MATTTNFGWETPDDSDLVKDGAAAMRTLGNSIDASMADLRGGTSGQILSKNSNTDMDFTWIANDQGDITAVTAGTGISGGGTSGAVTITNDMATTITASGDIVIGTGNGTYDNLPIGTTGQVLTADTTVSPYKVKWAAASSGGMTLLETITISGDTTSSTISGSYKHLFIVFKNLSTTANGNPSVRFNSDTGNNYKFAGTYADSAGSPTIGMNSSTGTSAITMGQIRDNSSGSGLYQGSMWVWRYTDTDIVQGTWCQANFTTNSYFSNGNFTYDNSAAITSITIRQPDGTLGGTMYIYGVS